MCAGCYVFYCKTEVSAKIEYLIADTAHLKVHPCQPQMLLLQGKPPALSQMQQFQKQACVKPKIAVIHSLAAWMVIERFPW